LYDSFIYTQRVLTDIGNTLLPLGKKIISDLHLEDKFNKQNIQNIQSTIESTIGNNIENTIGNNIENTIGNNIENTVENKLGKDFSDYLKNVLKPKVELEIKTKIKKELDNGLQEKITSRIEEKIKDMTPYIEQESLKFLNKINISNIQTITQNSYIEISLETRDYRYIYIYDKNDPEALIELINLIKFLNDVENLDYINDYYTKNLRYYRIPINIMRVIIKFGEYLRLF
jgi:hypothetical protein